MEFWPGKGVNAALATAHVAAVSVLSSMTKAANQPYFALSQRHLEAFSRQMTNVADQFGASRSMDLLPVPPASSRWSAVAAMTAEDVVHELMEQICERGATAVEHLWPIIPSLTLVEERLRQLIPSKVHLLRRMLRDGPWPGEGAEVMAPLKLPPLPSRRTQSSPAVLASTDPAVASPHATTAPTGRLQNTPHLASSRHDSIRRSVSPSCLDDTGVAQTVSRHDDISPATPLSCRELVVPSPHSASHAKVHVTHSPTINSAAPARTCPSQQSDKQPIQAPNALQHVSLDASSDQSSSSQSTPRSVSGQSTLSQSAPHSTGTVDSQTLSEIEAKIAVLTKWGQPLPPSLDLPQSSSRHAKRPTPWPRLKKQDVRPAEPLSICIGHADSAPCQQPAIDTPANVKRQMRPERASVAPAAAVLKQQAAVGAELPSHRVLKRTDSAHSTPQTPPQQSPKSQLHPLRAPAPSQGLTQQLQPASASSGSPSSTQSSPSLAQSSPYLAQSPSSLPQGSLPQSSSSLAQSSPQLPHQPPQQHSQETQGLHEVGPSPKAQSPLQMWPHVRKYSVPQPLTAPSTVTPHTTPPPPPRSPMGASHTKCLQPSNKVNQLQHQSPAQSSDRHSGMADSSIMDSSIMASLDQWCPSPLLKSATAPATVLSQMLTNLPADSQHPADGCIQPQTPLLAPSHRRMYSQDACQQQQADVAVLSEGHTMAGNVGNVGYNHTPEWLAHEGSSPQRGMARNAVDGNIWQTPQLPSTWSGQGMAPINLSWVD